MPDELDATPTDASNTDRPADESRRRADAGTDRPPAEHEWSSPADALEDAVGVAVPDEHVGAFVAEAFEDAERDTDWEAVVEAFVAPEAREAFAAMCERAQTAEVLDAAARFDERAAERLEDVPLTADADDEAVSAAVDEALRCRRNADRFRDGVAAFYADGALEDEALVRAVANSAFDTDLVARRERALERVDGVHDVDFRPYGGQLFDAEDGPANDVNHDAEPTW